VSPPFNQGAHRRGILLICLAAVLWSTGGVGIKALAADSPLKVTFYRSLFAAIALVLLFRRRVLDRSLWRFSPAFVVAVISYAACLTTFVFATKWTTAANAILLQYAGVIWVLLLSPIIVHEPRQRADIAAIAIALVGMALFFIGELQTRGMAGNVMALISSVCFAALVLALRREQLSSELAITAGNIVAAGVLLPLVMVGVGTDSGLTSATSRLALTPRSVEILAFLGVFQIGLAYALFVRGLRDVTATEASLTGMLEPVMNPLWVFIVVGERPGVRALIGGAIVIGAVAWRTFVTGAARAEMPAPD
jgi:DME family drug/metabolite transporter